MAGDKYKDNVEGSFYVDDFCINCSLCEAIAPTVFKTSDDGDHCVVFAQPEDEIDVEAADEAKEACPVAAIHKD